MRGCSDSGRTAIAGPRSVAQAFADHLNWVLNQTVSDARLTLVARPKAEDEFTLANVIEGANGAFRLHGAEVLLFVEHHIRVVDERCHTQSYSYRVQHELDRRAWLVRWEYLRNPPHPDYPYPLGHLHLNADWLGADRAPPIDKPLRKLHLATGRVAFEVVLWQLIAEWGVESRTEDWRSLLKASIEGFEERRRAF